MKLIVLKFEKSNVPSWPRISGHLHKQIKTFNQHNLFIKKIEESKCPLADYFDFEIDLITLREHSFEIILRQLCYHCRFMILKFHSVNRENMTKKVSRQKITLGRRKLYHVVICFWNYFGLELIQCILERSVWDVSWYFKTVKSVLILNLPEGLRGVIANGSASGPLTQLVKLIKRQKTPLSLLKKSEYNHIL